MSNDSEDPAEKARLDDEAFERLPPAVKLATLLERERKQKKLAANAQHSTGLALRGALLSFVLFFVFHVLFVHSILFTVAIGAAGAVAGWFVVEKNSSHLVAMILFGAVAIIGDVMAYATGVVVSSEMTFAFFIWLMLLASAYGIVLWARKHRESI